MAETSLIQARVDTELKNEASELFESLGLDMTTAIKVFLKRCLQEGGIPFEIRNNKESSLDALKAFMLLRQQAEANGVSDLTLDEINALIESVEKQMKKAATNLDFENAAIYRDQITELKKIRNDISE